MSKQQNRTRILSVLITSWLVMNASFVFAASPMISLDDSVALALKNNPAIKIADADKNKAQWGIDEAKAGGLPTLSLTGSDSRGNSAQGVANGFNTSLHLSMPLYTGGRVEGQVDQAKLNAHSAELGVNAAVAQTKLDATTKYFSVLQAKNMVQVNQDAVDSMTAHLQNVQAQYQVGTVAKGDVLQSEVQLANAQQNLTKAQNAYAVAQASFNNVIGQPQDTENSYQDDLGYVKFDMSLDDSIQLALTNRPEIGQADDSLRAAQVGVNVADSGRLPTVNFTGTAGKAGSDFPGNNNWSIGISANWNLFDGGVTKARVEEAKSTVAKATEQGAQTRDAIELEVRQNYLSMQEAEKRIDTSKVAVNQAMENLKIADEKYAAGVGTNLDVMDAQLALTQAKTNVTQALYDFNVDKAQLEKAIGSGAH